MVSKMHSDYLSKEDLEVIEVLKEIKERKRKLSEIAFNLGLPVKASNDRGPLIEMQDLWDIISDEKKLKEFVSRAKNKAFW